MAVAAGAEEATRPDAPDLGLPSFSPQGNCCQDPKMEKCIQVYQEHGCCPSVTVRPRRSHGSSFASAPLLQPPGNKKGRQEWRYLTSDRLCG